MKKIEETIKIFDPKTDALLASCHVEVLVSWYLYPLVFIKEKKYIDDNQNLFYNQGLSFPALPHEMQLTWFMCLLSWSRFKKKVIVPFIANLEYKRKTGHFANGTTSYDEITAL